MILLLLNSQGSSDDLFFLSFLFFAFLSEGSTDSSDFIEFSLELFGRFLGLHVVEQVLSEELNRIVGLFQVGLGKGFREYERDLVLSQVLDVGVFATEKVF